MILNSGKLNATGRLTLVQETGNQQLKNEVRDRTAAEAALNKTILTL